MEILDKATRHKLIAPYDKYMATDGWFAKTIMVPSMEGVERYDDALGIPFIGWCEQELGYYPYTKLISARATNFQHMVVYFKKAEHAAIFKLKWC
jgi:hypothetical protein